MTRYLLLVALAGRVAPASLLGPAVSVREIVSAEGSATIVIALRRVWNAALRSVSQVLTCMPRRGDVGAAPFFEESFDDDPGLRSRHLVQVIARDVMESL